MFEWFWNTVSFDMLPTFPMVLTLKGFIGTIILCFVPSYIVYSKQGISRKQIYVMSSIVFLLTYSVFFVSLSNFFFDRAKMTVLVKTLLAMLYVWSVLDPSGVNRKNIKARDFASSSFFERWLGNPLGSFFFHLFYGFFKILPLPIASAIGGVLGRFLGLFMSSKNKIVDSGLKIAFPKKSEEAKKKIKSGMWDMMGRYITEAPHIRSYYKNIGDYVEVEGEEILKNLKDKNQNFITFISHSGSMGIINTIFKKYNIFMNIVYRSPNNYLVDNITKKTFGYTLGNVNLLPKGKQASRDMLRVLQKNGCVSITPDQRQDRGLDLKFFGAKAPTAPGVAKLARHYGCPVIPVQLIRTKGFRHKIVIHKPFEVKKTKDVDADLKKGMQQVNDHIESWVEQNPEQWFWVHRRWSKKQEKKGSK